MAIPKAPANVPEYCYKVEDIFPPVGGVKAGEVGIEIEVEGRALPTKVPSYWAVHEENSLRGESREYALSKPIKRDSVLNILKYLSKYLEKQGAVVEDSQRTGVHVHLNMQGLTLREVFNVVTLYLIFEDLFVEYAGEWRVGNVFCLRVRDAEYFVDKVVDAIKRDNYAVFADELHMRYSSVNLCSLWKFNSLEFRAFRGTTDPQTIWEWTQMLLALKDAGLKYRNPREVLEALSERGVKDFFLSVFPGELASKLARPGYLDRIRESMWLIQEIGYIVDWQIPDKPPRKRVFGEGSRYPLPRHKAPLAVPMGAVADVAIVDDVPMPVLVRARPPRKPPGDRPVFIRNDFVFNPAPGAPRGRRG